MIYAEVNEVMWYSIRKEKNDLGEINVSMQIGCFNGIF